MLTGTRHQQEILSVLAMLVLSEFPSKFKFKSTQNVLLLPTSAEAGTWKSSKNSIREIGTASHPHRVVFFLPGNICLSNSFLRQETCFIHGLISCAAPPPPIGMDLGI